MRIVTVLLCACALAAGQPSGKPKHAKNVILLLADAGGLPVVNAASILAYDAPQKLFIQSMPFIGLSDTSPVGRWVTDSAAGMTAIVTGQKTRNGVISEDANVVRGQQDGALLKTILEYAEERGLSTGVMSNVSIADATPAACYAHANDRAKWGDIFSQIFSRLDSATASMWFSAPGGNESGLPQRKSAKIWTRSPKNTDESFTRVLRMFRRMRSALWPCLTILSITAPQRNLRFRFLRKIRKDTS